MKRPEMIVDESGDVIVIDDMEGLLTGLRDCPNLFRLVLLSLTEDQLERHSPIIQEELANQPNLQV